MDFFILATILGSFYLIRYLVGYLINRYTKPKRSLVRERLSKQVLVLEEDCKVGVSIPLKFPVDMRREIMVFHNGLLLSMGHDHTCDVSITPTELFFSFKLKAKDIIQVVQVLTPEP